jgi:hypothetical protein
VEERFSLKALFAKQLGWRTRLGSNQRPSV